MDQEVEVVERGVKLLDNVYPQWAQAIDLSTFNLASGASCVVGQVFDDIGGYARGLRKLDELSDGPENDIYYYSHRYGFERYDDDGDDKFTTYDGMQSLWVEAIKERQI